MKIFLIMWWVFMIKIHGLNILFSPNDKSQCSYDHSCLSMHLFEYRYSLRDISQMFAAIGNANETVRQAKITFHHPLTAIEMLELGNELDEFLTPRLWWSVLVEPFAWPAHEKIKEGILLTRYNPHFERHLRLQSAVQYPDAQTCSNSLITVDRYDGYHVAWGNNLWIKAGIHNHFPFIPTTSYNSLSNDPAAERESVAWISAHECNTTNNKWDCAFLPRTNCTLPDQLTKCKGEDCVIELGESFDGATLYSNASSTGKVIPQEKAVKIHDEAGGEKEINRVPLNALQKSLAKYIEPPPFKTVQPYNISMNNLVISGIPPNTRDSIYIFRAILRNNYRFRSLIGEFVHHFYHKNNINFGTRCVAAQVRRGDRVIKGVNMVELCKNATRPITAKNKNNLCKDFDGILRNCGKPEDNFEGGIAFDKGCERPVPFGGVTVDMIIRAAKQLAPPEVKTIFVSTDDETWLESEKKIAKRQHPEWTVVNLESPKPPIGAKIDEITSEYGRDRFDVGYEYMRYKSGAHSGAFFLASLQLAQQCEAFAGHFVSTVPTLFVAAMCHKSRNGQLEGVCPPVYDLSTGIV